MGYVDRMEPVKKKRWLRLRAALSSTMIYTHVLNRGPKAVRSPLD